MPLTLPPIDGRTYQDLRDEALARIPVHNPEWTNFNKSDPGVTLLELFAFLSESILYRARLIPERNRRKFLSLLGVGLLPGSSARGLVTFTNAKGPLQTVTLSAGVEARAGAVPFRTEDGLDVLPIDTLSFYKQPVAADATTRAYYDQLYASFRDKPATASLQLYRTTAFSPRATEPLEIGRQTVDSSIWIALLARPREAVEAAREAILGKTVSLGLVPAPLEPGVSVQPAGAASVTGMTRLQFQIPSLPAGGELPIDPDQRDASWRTLASVPVPAQPAVAQITLPSDAASLSLWTNLDPLEPGTRDFPPALDDAAVAARLVTWLRVAATGPSSVRLLWAGINAAFVSQRQSVIGEVLPDGTGEPDQQVKLARSPVLDGSVRIVVQPEAGRPETWAPIDDLFAAGPEVVAPDPRLPPGAPQPPPAPAKVFLVDAEAGAVRFGDGAHGSRPPLGARLRASYDFGVGRDGNVGPASIVTAPALPPGIQVTNPLPTWGGADPETVEQGEKQVASYLQHRDRAVTADDFRTLALRTPGVSVGRVDVLPATDPAFTDQPGGAAGAVTLLAVPGYEASPPSAGGADPFLDAIACWLAPRRLVTTQLFLRRPVWVPIWVSIGIDVAPKASVAVVREAVRQALADALSALPVGERPGWALLKAVTAQEVLFAAGRVDGVDGVSAVRLARGDGDETQTIPLQGLELPQLAGLAIGIPDAPPLAELRGQKAAVRPLVPVPLVPEECA